MAGQVVFAVIVIRWEVLGKVLTPEPLCEGGQVGIRVSPGPDRTPIGTQVQVLDARLVGDLKHFTRIPGPVQADRLFQDGFPVQRLVQNGFQVVEVPEQFAQHGKVALWA